MPNFEFLKNLFKVGITREQFISEYSKQFGAEKVDNNDLDGLSIFDTDKTEEVAGSLFDMLNIKKSEDGKPDVLDIDEITALSNFDKTDGENELTEADIKVLFKNYQESITKENPIDTPEKMYDNAMKKPSENGFPQDSYLKSLEHQISTIETLALNRQATSLQTIMAYRNEINELVQNDSSISEELKSQYREETEKLNSMQSRQSQLEAKIKATKDELDSANGEYENLQANIEASSDDESVDYTSDLSNAEKNISKCNSTLSSLQKESLKLGGNITKSKKALSSLQSKLKSSSSSLRVKIELINQKITAEETACAKDLETYNDNIKALKSAQEYAVQRVQTEASSSITSTDNGADTYQYDESNYDEKAVSALEQRWASKSSKLGSNDAERHKFFVKLTAIAKDLKCDPNSLLAVMNSECGLNPQATNKNGGATGLIQFMPSTARSLGTSTDALRSMSAYDQLDYVAKFLTKQKQSAKMGDGTMTAADLYSLIFLPARANRDILTTKGEAYYRCNAGLDMDGDGNISKADLNRRIQKCMV